ncbi:MAG: hypothetical protein MJZ37_02540 [Bacilli bacterium]|nr:hypothetical protein [Bacilli bacterium]
MSYKLSLMMSMIFVVFFSVFSIDLIMIQNSYALLDSKSINISYFLSKNGDVSSDAINYIERFYHVDFTLVSDSNPAFGDDIIYNLSTTYHPFIIGEEFNITIQRMTVVGYFN